MSRPKKFSKDKRCHQKFIKFNKIINKEKNNYNKK